MSENLKFICDRSECDNLFEKSTHNQKYCSDECCRIATNEKLRKAYYDKKDRLAGKKRLCKNKGCGLELSRYNSTKVCGSCESKDRQREKNILIELAKNVFS